MAIKTAGPKLRDYVETLEARLAPYASTSWGKTSQDMSRREREEPSRDLRTHYQRDRDRIIHSRSFRRLALKTQALPLGQNDHVRTRLTHSLEVGQTARAFSGSARD